MSKQLKQVRANFFYTKDDEGNLQKGYEFVLLLDQPRYIESNEGEIIRTRTIEEVRFKLFTEEALDNLIEILGEYKNSKEHELK